MEDEINAVVIDIGHSSWKAGMSNRDAPSTAFASILSRPITRAFIHMRDYYVGYDAFAFREDYKGFPLMESGNMRNWDDAEHAFHHTFYFELQIAPEEHPVAVTHPFGSAKAHSEKLTQILFETFNSPAIHLPMASEVAYHSESIGPTALMVDMGHDATTIVPITEGANCKLWNVKSPLGGSKINDYLSHMLLHEEQLRPITFYDRALIQDMKEEVSYVALNYETELEKYPAQNSSVLPLLWTNTATAGKMRYNRVSAPPLTLGSARMRCMELLFKPFLFGHDALLPLEESIMECVGKCDMSTRKALLENVVLFGGGSMVPGMAERLMQELARLAHTPVRIHCYPRRQDATWYGARNLVQHAAFQQRWLSKEEYDESGPSICIRKVF